MTPGLESPALWGDAAGFARDGYVVVRGLLDAAEVEAHRSIFDRVLAGDVDTLGLRSDLGADGSAPMPLGAERIVQIMWPSQVAPELAQQPLPERCLALARRLIGRDAAFDFDMMIDKAPGSSTPTPWHQDAAYWVDLPDERAVSIWVSLDEATLDSGCMWYVKGSNLGSLRPHWGIGAALQCECSEDEPGATPVPLRPGDAVAHAGRTLHYSRGNTTADRQRRAYILNYRPAAMIARERDLGMDHGLTDNKRAVRNTEAR